MPRPLATKRVFVPRKNRIVYVFNVKFEQVDSGPSKDIAEKYDLKNFIRVYISRKMLKDKKFYFSLSETFKIKKSKRTYNPFLQEEKKKKKEELKKYHINYKPPKNDPTA